MNAAAPCLPMPMPMPKATPSPVSHANRPAGSSPPPHDGLAPAQRRAMVGAIVAVHVAAAWGLLQVREVREAVFDVAPIFVSLVRPTGRRGRGAAAAAAARAAPGRAAAARHRRGAVDRAGAVRGARALPELPVLPQPTPPVAAPAPRAPPAPPAPPPAPHVIPASAVQYLEPLALEYPRLSKRLGETGRVLIRVFIDEAGLRAERAGRPQLGPSAPRRGGARRGAEGALQALHRERPGGRRLGVHPARIRTGEVT